MGTYQIQVQSGQVWLGFPGLGHVAEGRGLGRVWSITP